MTTPRPRLPAVSGLALLVGVGGGLVTEQLQGLLAFPWAAWADSVAVWSALGFLVGAAAGDRRRAAAAAVVTELLLVGSYYAVAAAQGEGVDVRTVAVWLAAGVVAGVVFGAAGSQWRSGAGVRRAAGAAVLGGVFVVEGVVRWVAFPWQGAAGPMMVAAGLAAPLLLGRSVRDRLLGLAGVAVVLPLGAAGWLLTEAALGG